MDAEFRDRNGTAMSTIYFRVRRSSDSASLAFASGRWLVHRPDRTDIAQPAAEDGVVFNAADSLSLRRRTDYLSALSSFARRSVAMFSSSLIAFRCGHAFIIRSSPEFPPRPRREGLCREESRGLTAASPSTHFDAIHERCGLR